MIAKIGVVKILIITHNATLRCLLLAIIPARTYNPILMTNMNTTSNIIGNIIAKGERHSPLPYSTSSFGNLQSYNRLAQMRL